MTTCFGVCAGHATWPSTMSIHNVRSVARSQCPVHCYASCPPTHAPMYPPPTTLAPLTTATLKPLCLISVENYPAVVDLHYSKLQ
jgi:hypothetical protein